MLLIVKERPDIRKGQEYFTEMNIRFKIEAIVMIEYMQKKNGPNKKKNFKGILFENYNEDPKSKESHCSYA